MATHAPASKAAKPAPAPANGTGIRTAEAVDQIAADIDSLRAELVALTASVAKLGGEAADTMRQHTGEITGDVAAVYKAGISDLSAELGRLENRTARSIQANPLQAVGIAAGIGFLLALITRR